MKCMNLNYAYLPNDVLLLNRFLKTSLCPCFKKTFIKIEYYTLTELTGIDFAFLMEPDY